MHKAILGWPILLVAASCVPAVSGGTPGVHAAAAAPALLATPGFRSLSLPVASEEPPPPEKLAEEIAVGTPARPFDLGPATQSDAQTALNCLTAAVYYEARSESEGGQRAVAQVVLNRVRHPAFPKTVCGVVYQGSNRSTGCQFSFTCDGSLAHAREGGAWDRARKIAEEALSGFVYAPVGLATHYHTTAIRPWWASAMAKAVTIGSHIFYRWHGEWGDPRSYRRPYVGAERFAGASSPGDAPAATQASGEPAGTVELVAGVRLHRDTQPVALASAATGGVRIHRTEDTSHGVRIHRADAGAEDSPAADAPASTPAETEVLAAAR